MNDSLGDRQSIFRSILVIATVVLINIGIGALIIKLIGADPSVAYRALLNSSLGSMGSLTFVLTRMAPLVLSGLAVSVAFRAGIYNLGGEGQIYLGAFAAALLGFQLSGLPRLAHLPMAIMAAAIAGLIGAWIPGWLRVRHKVDEVISTLLLNTVYNLLTGYLASEPFRDPARWSGTTPQIASSARLPVIWPDTGLNIGFILAVITAILMFLVFHHTDIGYRWKMIGLNREFARYGGITVERDQLKAMMVSGALAGMAGGLLVVGSQFRFWAQIGGGIGWDGILIALLARNDPIEVLVAGFFFAFVKTGSLGMESASSVPSELTSVLLAVLILLVTARDWMGSLMNRVQRLGEVS